MANAFELQDLTKKFDNLLALDKVTLAIPERRIVGLIGRNGSGKTTLLHHVVGLQLATSGACTTLGHPAATLGSEQLAQIGVVWQEGRFLDWMTVERHIDYVASFYRDWDRDRERRLLHELELEPNKRVGTLTPGNAEKLGLILAVCHHPRLLLLDEPMSALDPITRRQVLAFLLELLHEDEVTTVISSHVLRDIEEIVEWIVCLDRGRVTVDCSLDALQERYCEWVVTSSRPLAHTFDEPWILQQRTNNHKAHLMVRDAEDRIDWFEGRYEVEVVSQPLNLERIFPLLHQRRNP